MNKQELLNEKLEQEHQDDLYAEANRRERSVHIEINMTIESHDDQLAYEQAIDILNEGDVYDYITHYSVD